MNLMWKMKFTPLPSDQLVLGCTGKVLDSKGGVLDAYIFISTNYIFIYIDNRMLAVIALRNVICWCKAIKVDIPTAPFVKLDVIPNHPGKPVPPGVPDAIQLFTRDEKLHMFFGFSVPYGRFCYAFDSTWRLHHPSLQQMTETYQQRKKMMLMSLGPSNQGMAPAEIPPPPISPPPIPPPPTSSSSSSPSSSTLVSHIMGQQQMLLLMQQKQQLIGPMLQMQPPSKQEKLMEQQRQILSHLEQLRILFQQQLQQVLQTESSV